MSALACKICTPRTVVGRMSERGCTCIADCGHKGCTGDESLTSGVLAGTRALIPLVYAESFGRYVR